MRLSNLNACHPRELRKGQERKTQALACVSLQQHTHPGVTKMAKRAQASRRARLLPVKSDLTPDPPAAEKKYVRSEKQRAADEKLGAEL